MLTRDGRGTISLDGKQWELVPFDAIQYEDGDHGLISLLWHPSTNTLVVASINLTPGNDQITLVRYAALPGFMVDTATVWLDATVSVP